MVLHIAPMVRYPSLSETEGPTKCEEIFVFIVPYFIAPIRSTKDKKTAAFVFTLRGLLTTTIDVHATDPMLLTTGGVYRRAYLVSTLLWEACRRAEGQAHHFGDLSRDEFAFICPRP